MTEATITPEPTPAPPRRSPIRRIGCGCLLIGWFVILLLPCALIVLAVQQQIVISTGSAPGQETRIWLISEPTERGFGISTASARQTGDDTLCVQTNVRFLLWAGQADPLSYCECYARTNAGDPWTLTGSSEDTCSG